MELEKKKKERKILRTVFTKNANEFETLKKDSEATTGKYKMIEGIYTNIQTLDKEICQLMLDVDCAEDILEKEINDAMKYKENWFQLQIKFNSPVEMKSHIQNDGRMQRNFKLPAIELKKFDGDIKNWLSFWGQFQKIDADPNLDETDKFQYLIQSMTPDTEVKSFVDSFPPSDQCYALCITELKSRYARDELLIQVYVRELLALILHKEKVGNMELTTLYDKLNAHLRSLEILGVTKDKYSAFLLPMVESALPLDILRTWERAKPIKMEDELSSLLSFLKREVESEQRITMAQNSFGLRETKSALPFDTNDSGDREPTAGCLLTNVRDKPRCVWCDRETHSSLECFKVQKMSIDERREHLRKQKACTICLKKGHHAKVCRAFVRCLVCGRRHTIIMCTGKNQDDMAKKPKPELATNLSAVPKYQSEVTLLQTVVVRIMRDGKQMLVRAMFDSGSQRSYIREDIAFKLSIPVVGKQTLTHNLFGGVELNSKEYDVYNFNVENLDKTISLNMSAIGQPCICKNIPKYKCNDYLTSLLTKHNITLSDSKQLCDDNIGLLIGVDFSGVVLTGNVIKLQGSLVAIDTKLGWALQGVVPSTSTSNIATNISMFCSFDVSDFWSLETIGIRDPIENKTRLQTEEDAMVNFEQTVMVNQNNRYEVYLPWKVGHDDLLNNYELAVKRLESSTKKLNATGVYNDYDKVFAEWEKLGIIEQVAVPELGHERSHYLPHRPVIKESSLTTRIRPVFDASAKDAHGKSLNLCLEKGANLLDKIPTLLNGFRKGAIGITSDICKAFLQISITPTDRDMLRFLWWNDKGEIITFRHCRVVFGLTCSPFLLSATIQHHLNSITGGMSSSARLLSQSFYVDNCITSLDTEQEARSFESEARQIMAQKNFDLRQWVISPLPEQKLDVDISILGLQWSTLDDSLGCNLSTIPTADELTKVTKRSLLSITQRIFDPIGFTCPVALVPRLILQEAWRQSLPWDKQLPVELHNRFLSWYRTLKFLGDCKIPRRLTNCSINSCKLELHMFCDASKYGYAACVFLRSEAEDKVSLRLVSAKSRIAPIGNISIPRLELLAALIGSRLLEGARKDLGMPCTERCWTDSSVVLCWIKRQLPWNTYVGNRVKEIRLNSNINDWWHIPGTQNWADLASRGCDAKQLCLSQWVEGPTWLLMKQEQWPNSNCDIDMDEVNRELKVPTVNNNVNITSSILQRFTYFSKYSKIVRMLAWILRFVNNLRRSCKSMRGEISCEEYESAGRILLKCVQLEHVDFINQRIKGLKHFHDEEGTLRLQTKLLLSDVPETTKFPVVLPASSVIVQRLVEQRHRQLQHAGYNVVAADLRCSYWIVGARKLIKSIISHCGVCKRYRSKPVQPPTAPLPQERTQSSAPFENTGIDLAGPLQLRDGTKCWIVLFTCAVYRAVHLELTNSLSTDAFMMTLRRFIARRGRMSVIISDNGTNFIGSRNMFMDINWDEIQQESTIRRIRWKLNAPTAAWWGGFYERLIRMLKDLLKRVLGRSSVSYEELQTILCDCEATLNDRPLTYIEDGKCDSLEPLKPSCFIQPISGSNVTDIDVLDTRSMNKRLRYMQKLRADFRERFKNEYLSLLVQRASRVSGFLSVGDVVLIETDEKRVKWPLGVIVEIYAGKDGVNRTAKIKTSSGYKVRPFQRLYPMEVTCPEKDIPVHQKVTRSGRVSKLPSRYKL